MQASKITLQWHSSPWRLRSAFLKGYNYQDILGMFRGHARNMAPIKSHGRRYGSTYGSMYGSMYGSRALASINQASIAKRLIVLVFEGLPLTAHPLRKYCRLCMLREVFDPCTSCISCRCNVSWFLTYIRKPAFLTLPWGRVQDICVPNRFHFDWSPMTSWGIIYPHTVPVAKRFPEGLAPFHEGFLWKAHKKGCWGPSRPPIPRQAFTSFQKILLVPTRGSQTVRLKCCDFLGFGVVSRGLKRAFMYEVALFLMCQLVMGALL